VGPLTVSLKKKPFWKETIKQLFLFRKEKTVLQKKKNDYLKGEKYRKNFYLFLKIDYIRKKK